MIHLIFFRLEIPFLVNLGQKVKIARLSFNLGIRLIPIPDFRVSMAILNPVEISCRWCKLNFRAIQGQVKSRQIKTMFLHFLKCSLNN